MASQIQQGTLNRLRGSVVFADFPGLQVTAAFLGKEGISINPEGDTALQIPTMTGTVGSPEPFQMVTVTVHLLRTQALADAYKAQIETDTSVGSMNVIPDAATLSNYQIEECSIVGWQEMTFNGTEPGFQVRIRGTYYINSALWAAS
jgi:hypothetical protein